MSQKNSVIVIVLIATVIIDIMGMGLVFPLMPSLFLIKDSIFVHGSSLTHYIFYGIGMASWPLGLFFGPPVLGDASDRFGRKRVLIACLLMMAITYIVGAFAIGHNLMWVFIISRLFSGFFSGSFILGQAVMVDIAPDHLRSRYLGWMTMAASIGIVVGPLITSLTAGSSTVSWFSEQTPLYIAFGLALLNLLSVSIFLKETDAKRRMVKLSLMNAVKTCVGIFTDKRTRVLGFCFLAMQLGWGFYISDVPLILSQEFHLNVQYIGYFFALLGLAVFIGVIFVQPLVLKWFSLRKLSVVALILTCLILFISVVFKLLTVQWFVIFFATIPELIAYTALLTLLSKAVNDDEQGRIMGGTGAIYGISWVINAVLIGLLSNVDIYIPIVLGCASFAAAAGIIWLWKEKASS